MKKQEWETSLPPHYYYHYCSECSWFYKEYSDLTGYYRNYCLKKPKTVPPDKRACSDFFFPHPEAAKAKTRPFVWKKGRCHWCAREFSYKAHSKNYERLFCKRRHKRRYERFWKEQDSASNVYSFSLSWGGQPATSPNSMMEIITPTRIAYFNQPKFLRGYYCLFVVDKFGRYVRSAFVALDG